MEPAAPPPLSAAAQRVFDAWSVLPGILAGDGDGDATHGAPASPAAGSPDAPAPATSPPPALASSPATADTGCLTPRSLAARREAVREMVSMLQARHDALDSMLRAAKVAQALLDVGDNLPG